MAGQLGRECVLLTRAKEVGLPAEPMDEVLRVRSGDLLPFESAFKSSLCLGFGPLLTVGDTPAG